jgi:glyoxalase family protein
MTVAAAGPTVEFLRTMLGFDVLDTIGPSTRLGVAARPGTWIDVHEASDVESALNGLGTVHHAALAVASADDQLAIREALIDRGFSVTPVMDRQYFQSIYFREPGGVLLEIATVRPGFDVDEPVDELGRALKLPPWEEPNRALIEATLPPITPPE